MLQIITIGALTVLQQDKPRPLPASRKTRALLAYLVINGGTHSRQALCEMFWDIPDDPRAALRWSLSKLRPLLNEEGNVRLVSDRDRVSVELRDIAVDFHQIAAADCADPAAAAAAWEMAAAPLLDDCDLPNQPEFTAWLQQQRNELVRRRVGLARRLACDDTLDPPMQDRWAERWLQDAPFDCEAAVRAVRARRAIGREADALALEQRLVRDFDEAGVDLPDFTRVAAATDPAAVTGRGLPPDEMNLQRQVIRFVQTSNKISIAWASVGEKTNPPLVKAANWLSHLELDWQAPIWSPLFRELAQSHHFIRYDERGCGLSDWEVDDISLDSFVTDLELVVDAAGLERFPLLGISQGAAVSIEYAARHPERVSHLILFGGYDCGWRHTASSAEVREREAVMVLTETGWGSDNPAYRHMFSQTFMPDATHADLEWFDEFQRQTTSSKNAVRFLDAFSWIDVSDRLGAIRCPTLVVHSRGDMRIPFATGRRIAQAIPGAQFAGIDSNNHLLVGDEPASGEFLKLVREFLSD